jgi:glycosyltransferase involved in cell wall biosynthesis
MKNPLVSVVMPVRNAGLYLTEALDSIFAQSYKNFELIAVNDGSTDETIEILNKYQARYRRLKVYHYKNRVGFVKALSFGFSLAQGKLLARMDADDISAPNRLEKQVSYLLNNDTAVAVGGACRIIDGQNRIIGFKDFPTVLSKLYLYLVKIMPYSRTTLMINRKKLPKDFTDIDNWAHLSKYGKIENIRDVVLYCRVHKKNASVRNLKKSLIAITWTRIKKYIMANYTPTKRKTLLKLN